MSVPDQVVQVLFGRHRAWGNIQWVHLILVASILVATIYVYVLLLKKRLAKYRTERNRIPRKNVPRIPSKDDDFAVKPIMSRRMYLKWINEMVRVDELQHSDLMPEENPGQGDPGYGAENSNRPHVHFNTSIAQSYFVLEKTARDRRPGLRHQDSRGVRDYVAKLRMAFPGLGADLCEKYVNTYERAAFSDHKFTLDEYTHFESVVYQLVAAINQTESRADRDDMGSIRSRLGHKL